MAAIITDLSMKRAREKRNADRMAIHHKTSTVKPTDEWRPGLKSWQHRGGTATFVPDRGFTKQLKALDKELDVVLNEKHGKWEIWRFPSEGKVPCHMMTIQEQDKSYREMGADILIKLQEGDPWRFGEKELFAYFEELDNQVMRRKEKDFNNLIESMVKETSSYTLGVMKRQVPIEYQNIGTKRSDKIRRAICGSSG